MLNCIKSKLKALKIKTIFGFARSLQLLQTLIMEEIDWWSLY